MMKPRAIVLLAIVALLFVGGVALRQAQGSALAQSSGPPTLAGYTIRHSVTTGGRYHLTSAIWQVDGASSGGNYHLTALLGPTGTGTPCCCTYLPCVLRNY